MVSSTPRPHFTPVKDTVPILQEAGWVPGSVRTGGKSLPHRYLIPDRLARSQSQYRLSYRAHTKSHTVTAKSEAFTLLWMEFVIPFWLTFLRCVIGRGVSTLYTFHDRF